MARQNINIGTTANDGTGDKLRVAFDKVNDNFIELYELGDKGSKGDKGEPGTGGGGAGAQGAQGVQGATGAKGEVGAQGDQGAVGAQGLQGEQGVQGAIGTKGEPGAGGGAANLGNLEITNTTITIANGAPQTTIQIGNSIANLFVDNDTGAPKVKLQVGSTDSAFYEPGFGYTSGTWVASGLGGTLNITGYDAGFETFLNDLGQYASFTITINGSETTATDGYGYGSGNAYFTTVLPPGVDPTTVTSVQFNLVYSNRFLMDPDDGTMGIYIGDHNFNIESLRDVRIRAEDDFSIYAVDGFDLRAAQSVRIISNYNSTQRTWQFNNDGTLQLPSGSYLGNVATLNLDGNVSNVLAGDGTWVPMSGGASLPLANGTSNVDIALANGAVSVTANAFTWIFNETNGLLELAGNLANFSACSAINFVANSSGDGYGYSTIELRPDSNATSDQYLIVDPTSPNHIHIRAGGQQDNSNAEIYLGGENSYFKVNDGENPLTSIASNSYVWTFNSDGSIIFPDSTVQNTAFTGGATGAQGVQGEQGAAGPQGDQGAEGPQGFQGLIGAQGDQGAEGPQGDQGAEGPQGFQGLIGAQGDQGIAGPQGDQGAAGAQGDQGVAGPQGDQGAQGTKGDKGDAGTASLPIANGTSSINIANASSNVTVTANSYTWNFDETGRLNLPLGSNNKSAITFATNPGGGLYDQADIQFYAVSGENTVLEIKNRNDTLDSIKLDASGPIRIATDGDGNIGGPYMWEFTTNGAIVFPDSTIQTTAFTGAGAQGAQGVQGAAGSTGAQGVQGAAGTNGAQGEQGVQGATGSTGAQGFQGVQGAAGTNGAQGEQGVQGANGTAASLSNLTANINWTATNANPPTFTTSSIGSKLVLWPATTATSVDYGIGIEAGFTWLSVPQATNGFGWKWYGGNTTVATLLANGAYSLTGNANISGSIYAGTSLTVGGNPGDITNANAVFANTVTLNGTTTGISAIIAGVPTTVLPNTIASFTANVNNYTQVTLQNRNTGADATADYVLTADNGTDTVNYLDLGIIGSGYDANTPTNSLGNLISAADGYLYAQGNTNNTSQSGGNLAIGVTTPGKVVKIFAGGANNNSIIATVSNTGINVASGYLTMPTRPAFRVYGANTTNNLTTTQNGDGTLTANNFAVDFQQGSSLNVLNGTFTAPVAGLYQVNIVARNAGFTSGISQLIAYKNATAVAMIEFAANSSMNHAGSSTIVKLAVNDTLKIKVGAGQINFDSNDNWSVAFLG